MDYTNEFIEEMAKRQENNIVYSKYYFRISTNFEGNLKEKLEKKSNRIKDCLSLMVWDKYEQNKVLDLLRVDRCMDKFCTNCRTFGIAKVLHNFRPAFELMLNQGYKPFLLTLTVPNVQGKDLEYTIRKMNKAFTTFFTWLNKEGAKGFSKRFIKFKACVKVLEVNVQASDHNMYHPHFHVLLFLDSEEFYELDDELEKNIEGSWSKKFNKRNYYCALDIQIMQLWYMAFNGSNITQFDCCSELWYELYQTDFKPLSNKKGLFEVFKYTFKDKDIYNVKNFSDLYFALENKRLRQGYGELYNLKLEEECGDKLELDLEIIEAPQQLLTKELKTLYTVYQGYKKISRFNAHKDIDKIH